MRSYKRASEQPPGEIIGKLRPTIKTARISAMINHIHRSSERKLLQLAYKSRAEN